MQIKGSNINGVNIKNNPIEELILLVFNSTQTTTPPKKLLPISPINILEGFQLKNKKPIVEPIIPNIDPFIKDIEEHRKIKINPDRSPSTPSMKLQKFIIPVEIMIIKIIIKLSKMKLS